MVKNPQILPKKSLFYWKMKISTQNLDFGYLFDNILFIYKDKSAMLLRRKSIFAISIFPIYSENGQFWR